MAGRGGSTKRGKPSQDTSVQSRRQKPKGQTQTDSTVAGRKLHVTGITEMAPIQDPVAGEKTGALVLVDTPTTPALDVMDNQTKMCSVIELSEQDSMNRVVWFDVDLNNAAKERVKKVLWPIFKYPFACPQNKRLVLKYLQQELRLPGPQFQAKEKLLMKQVNNCYRTTRGQVTQRMKDCFLGEWKLLF